MNPSSLSLWEQTQLVLLRFVSLGLGLVDRLFGVHWGEHLLERLANRWQAQLDQLDRTLAELEEERRQIQLREEALSIQAAVLYLGGRSLARDELCFDPADAHDERILDASIDLLVKQRLAFIEPEEVEAGHFVYHLAPDWVAIHSRLRQAADQADLEVAGWFHETIHFIDEAFLPQADNRSQQSPSSPNQE